MSTDCMRHVFVYLIILILWQTKMKGSRKKTNTTKVYLKISRRKKKYSRETVLRYSSSDPYKM